MGGRERPWEAKSGPRGSPRPGLGRGVCPVRLTPPCPLLCLACVAADAAPVGSPLVML